MSKHTPEQRCSNSVQTGIGIQLQQCLRKAVVTRNGKGYCKQHDPVQVERKRAERSKAWEAQWKRERDEGDRRQACEDALAGIPDPAAYIKAMREVVDAAEQVMRPPSLQINLAANRERLRVALDTLRTLSTPESEAKPCP